MFITRADIDKNRLYITLKGAFEEKEAKLAANRIAMDINKLQTGFDVITDISTIESSMVEAAEELAKVHKFLKESGVNKIVRVVGKHVEQIVGKLQFDLVSQDSGIMAETVDTMAEADLLLDNLSKEGHQGSKVLPLRKEQ